MTIDKAIEILKEIKHYLCAGNPIWNTDMVAEAIDIAIERMNSPKQGEIECFRTDRYKSCEYTDECNGYLCLKAWAERSE